MIDVKLFRITTGEEVVAELGRSSADILTVRNGLVVLPTNNGVGFAPWATVIDNDNPEIELSWKHIIYRVPVQEDVAKKYNEMFGSKLITPDKKKLVL